MNSKNKNWTGQLELGFSLKEGRSILSKCNHSGPFLVQRSFYSRDDLSTPHVYLLHPSGGLVGGDRLVLFTHLEPGSCALLTTPGSSKFYSTNGMYALQEYTFNLQKNSILEWIPQSSIFFSKTKAKIKTIFNLEEGSKIIAFEMLCFQNTRLHSNPEEVDNFLQVVLPSSVGLRDRFRVNELDYMSKLNGFQISALFFAVPSDEVILKKVRKLMKSMLNTYIGGATLLDELLIVKLLGNNNQKLNELLHSMWSVARLNIIGKKSVIPRIWFT